MALQPARVRTPPRRLGRIISFPEDGTPRPADLPMFLNPQTAPEPPCFCTQETPITYAPQFDATVDELKPSRNWKWASWSQPPGAERAPFRAASYGSWLPSANSLDELTITDAGRALIRRQNNWSPGPGTARICGSATSLQVSVTCTRLVRRPRLYPQVYPGTGKTGHVISLVLVAHPAPAGSASGQTRCANFRDSKNATKVEVLEASHCRAG